MKYHGIAINGSSRGLTVCLGVAFGILFVTGCLLAPSMLEFRLGWDVIWRLPASDRLVTVAAHVLGGFVLLTLLGSIWTLHMRSGWRMKRNRLSGATFIAIWAALTLTGVGILYLGGEATSIWSSAAHTVLGLTTPVILAVHVATGLRSRRAVKTRQTSRFPDRIAAE